jgi:hypothetical protein
MRGANGKAVFSRSLESKECPRLFHECSTRDACKRCALYGKDNNPKSPTYKKLVTCDGRTL